MINRKVSKIYDFLWVATPWEKNSVLSWVTDFKLKLTPERFGIKKTKPLPKPFKEEDVVTGAIKARDRFANSCLVVAKGRVISVPNCVFREGKKVKVKITRDKHNIFNGKLL